MKTIPDFQIVKYLNNGKTELKCTVIKGEHFCGVLEVFEFSFTCGRIRLWKETANTMRLNAEDALEDARLIMIDTIETCNTGSI